MIPSQFRLLPDFSPEWEPVIMTADALVNLFSDKLKFCNDVVDISKIQRRRSIAITQHTCYKLLDTVSAYELETLRKSYPVYDSTNTVNIEGIVGAERFRQAPLFGWTLEQDRDFSVSATGMVSFFYDILSEVKIEARRVTIRVPGLLKTFNTLMFTFYGNQVLLDEDWYYNRLGIFLGYPEYTDPGLVVSTYKCYAQGCTRDNVAAYLNAHAGGPTALHNEIVTGISTTVITTDTDAYTVPTGFSIIVHVGQVLSQGDALTTVCEIVDNDSYPEWYNDTAISDFFSGTPIPDEAISFDPADTDEPFMLTSGTSVFWFNMPSFRGFFINYCAGSEPELVYTLSNVNIEVAWSSAYNGTITFTVAVTATGVDVTLNAVTTSYDVTYDWQTADNGFMFRIAAAATTGDTATGSLTVSTVTASRAVDTITIAQSSCAFVPTVGDCIHISDTSYNSYRSFITSIIEVGTDYEIEIDSVATAVGKEEVSDLITDASVDVVLYRSYDGLLHNGSGSILGNPMQMMFDMWKTTLPLIVTDSSLLPKIVCEDCLRQLGNALPTYVGAIVEETANLDDFKEIINAE